LAVDDPPISHLRRHSGSKMPSRSVEKQRRVQ
jgi:hypothetical protein